MPVATVLVQQAFVFAINPTPRQLRQLQSHAGGARYAFNWGLAQIGAALDARKAAVEDGKDAKDIKVPDHFGLCQMWTSYKDDHVNKPDDRGRTTGWVADNFVGSYQAALRDAAVAWKNFFSSRAGKRRGRAVGRPRFKAKGRSRDSFQMHGGSLRLLTGAEVRPAVKPTKPAKLSRAARAKLKKHSIEKLREHRTRRAAYQYGPAVSNSGTVYVNLPKIGPVQVPGKVRIGDWADRNARKARKLVRALRESQRLGLLGCPACDATGETTRVNKDGEEKQVKCSACGGKSKVPHARIIRATLSRGASGTWWCSVTAELVVEQQQAPTRRQNANGIVGLDLGTRHLAVDSDGTVWANPRHLDVALGELRTAQQQLSRTQQDSRRREKARKRVGAIHERVALLRKDAIDRITSRIAQTYAGVAVEGWDAQRLASQGSKDLPKKLRRRRNRQLADAAPGMFRWQLEYKTSRSGSTFYKIDKGLETGRTCSVCGTARAKPVPLENEMFVCESAACGTRLDRRVNSARVVRAAATGGTKPGAGESTPTPPKPRGGGVRPETVNRDGHPPVKRAARSLDRKRTGKRKQSKAGTSDP